MIFSPVLMKSGTLISTPVSSVTVFCTLLALSPLRPSGALATVRTTLGGSSMITAFSSTKVMVTRLFSVRKFLASPTNSGVTVTSS